MRARYKLASAVRARGASGGGPMILPLPPVPGNGPPLGVNDGNAMVPAAYTTIARALGRSPAGILFVSDVTAELSAARKAGLQVLLSLRPGNAVQSNAGEFEAVESFDAIQV